MKTIALLTDFGTDDPYVGMMKGVIKRIVPHASVIDLSHAVEKHSIEQGAFLLLSSYRYFPKGTIFVAVVDPGVGSKRCAIAIKTKQYVFIGPDNGILYPAAASDGPQKVISLDTKKWHLPRRSLTFHGRDVFAPAAAHLAEGVAWRRLGSTLKEITPLTVAKCRKTHRALSGKILYIDSFGNLITNISVRTLKAFSEDKGFCARCGKKTVTRIYRCYEDAGENEPFFIEGGFALLEISLKNKSAQKFFKARTGMPVRIRRCAT